MLLKIDGYDKNWTTGECQLNNENNDLTNNQTSQRPFAVSQLNDNLSHCFIIKFCGNCTNRELLISNFLMSHRERMK